MEEPGGGARQGRGLCRERIPARFGYRSIDDIQVLTPMHRGTVGAFNLNVELQKAAQPLERRASRGEAGPSRRATRSCRSGTTTTRTCTTGTSAGSSKIDAEEQEVNVNFDGKFVGYDFSELDELVLAYATSVHKAQGSEYPAVVIPILTQHYLLLQRNLLYTGITRGKKLVVLVGTKKALSIAVHNNKTQLRYTLLKERLQRR